jgi:hypothetical protein
MWVTGEKWSYANWDPYLNGGSNSNYLAGSSVLECGSVNTFAYGVFGFSLVRHWAGQGSVRLGSYILERGAYSDAKVADTDEDGYSDKQEKDAGSDPTDNLSIPGQQNLDIFSDEDGDTLCNGLEFVLQTNPRLRDTDSDGFDDNIEVSSGTDPRDPYDYSDWEAPVVSLIDSDTIMVGKNSTFIDPGANCVDNVDEPRVVYSDIQVDTSQPGIYRLRYQAQDRRRNSAASVFRTVIVAAGFDDWLGSRPVTRELAEKYAFGGAVTPEAERINPVVSKSETELVLSVFVRTNDPNVSVWGEAATELGGFTSLTGTRFVSGVRAESQDGVPEGYERREFRMNTDGLERGFLRVRANLGPQFEIR